VTRVTGCELRDYLHRATSFRWAWRPIDPRRLAVTLRLPAPTTPA